MSVLKIRKHPLYAPALKLAQGLGFPNVLSVEWVSFQGMSMTEFYGLYSSGHGYFIFCGECLCENMSTTDSFLDPFLQNQINVATAAQIPFKLLSGCFLVSPAIAPSNWQAISFSGFVMKVGF
jgi:hypothetical protein